MTTEQEARQIRIEARQQRIEARQQECEECDASLGQEIRATRQEIEDVRPGIPPVLIELAVGTVLSVVGLGVTWLTAKLGIKTGRVVVAAVHRRRRRKSASLSES